MEDGEKLCGCGCGKTKSVVISEIMSGPAAYNREQAEAIFDDCQQRSE